MIDRQKLYADIGRRIKDARRPLTQSELAQRLGVKRTSITNIEKGSQRATLFFLYSVAQELGIPLQRLLPAVDDPNILDAGIMQALPTPRLQKKSKAQVLSFVQKI